MLTRNSPSLRAVALGLFASTAIAGAASATQIEITVTNHSAVGGLFLTPFATFFHDGNFDTFDLGASASTPDFEGLEELAEDGNEVPVFARAAAEGVQTALVTGPNGVGGALGGPPLIDAGETTTLTVDLELVSGEELYFSFLSMLLPTNDNFIGNGNPFAYELFDANGNFTGLPEIEVFGNEIWDAGTEENNGLGLPFSPNSTGAVDTADNVTALSSLELLSFIDRPTPPPFGLGPISSVQGANDLLATISFTQIAAVPVPAALPMLLGGLGLLGVTGLRRRKTS